MKVTVAYASLGRPAWLVSVTLSEGATVGDAITSSGILTRFPEINLETQKVGIFGKIVPLTAPVEEGARVEIYRAIIADPATVHRRARPQ